METTNGPAEALRAALAAEPDVHSSQLNWLLGKFGPEYLDELVGLIDHPNDGARYAVLHTLGGFGPAALPALRPVLECFGSKQRQYQAGEVVKRIGSAAVPELLAIRAQGPGRLRRHALHALALLGEAERLTERDRAAIRRLVDIKLLDEQATEEEWEYCWLAVPGEEYRAAFEVLGLHDPVPATLAMGRTNPLSDEVEMVDDDGTKRTVRRVFVTPEFAGWRLFFGNHLMLTCFDNDLVVRVAEACGRAHFHYKGDFGEAHHWVIAERGRGVVRSYAAEGDPEWTGEPLPWERPQTEDPYWDPDEGETPGASMETDSAEAAARSSIDPDRIDEDTPRSGHGWLLVTEPGFGHGEFYNALEI
ncbi:HEAT repeat domain-containing protein [Kitasatospora sp. NPDC057198]|uniref:HEAT repeat domain-containing protein n=1 Tax=Kitasatospora sp. NPDC057198 TaxID=3346046 RepID=UPI00362EB230